MIIFPAVDIQKGQAVRLKQGLRESGDVFSSDPLNMAKHWRDQGAEWLHVVDLDGAFDGASENVAIIERICQETELKVQIGGGIRTIETAKNYIKAGATRLIIGTIALEKPEILADMCFELPGKIGVSLDAHNGKLKTRGWAKETDLTVDELLPTFKKTGVAFIIYTDIERDGMHSGINLYALQHILEITDLPVIAAGGVSNMSDVQAVYSLHNHTNLEGLISGRALYEKTLNLAEALKWLSSQAL